MAVEQEEVVKKAPSMKLVKKAKVTEPEPTTMEDTNGATTTEEPTAEVKASVKPKKAAGVDVSDDIIVQSVHEIENMKEVAAFKAVPALVDNIDHTYFKLGGILALIQDNGWYMDRGYENFMGYVEAEAGMEYRKAMYLISIYNGLTASGVPWEKVKHFGWTKLSYLANILTLDNVDEWVAATKDMTVFALKDYIKAKSAGAPSDGADPAEEAKKVSSMTFKVHSDQKQTIREALDKCKHESGTEFDAVALEYISLNYLGGEIKVTTVATTATATISPPAELSLADVLKKYTAEEVLEAFGEVFPDVELEATLP